MEAQRQKFSCPLDITTWMHSHHLNWMTPKLKTTPSFPLSHFFNKRHINLACPNHNPETPLFLLAYYVYMNCPWLFNSSTSHSFLFAHYISATSDSFYCGSMLNSLLPQSLCISSSFYLELLSTHQFFRNCYFILQLKCHKLSSHQCSRPSYISQSMMHFLFQNIYLH